MDLGAIWLLLPVLRCTDMHCSRSNGCLGRKKRSEAKRKCEGGLAGRRRSAVARGGPPMEGTIAIPRPAYPGTRPGSPNPEAESLAALGHQAYALVSQRVRAVSPSPQGPHQAYPGTGRAPLSPPKAAPQC